MTINFEPPTSKSQPGGLRDKCRAAGRGRRGAHERGHVPVVSVRLGSLDGMTQAGGAGLSYPIQTETRDAPTVTTSLTCKVSPHQASAWYKYLNSGGPEMARKFKLTVNSSCAAALLSR